MEYKELKDVLNTLRKGQLGVNVVACISCNKQLTKKGERFMNRAEKVTIGFNVKPTTYGGMVNAKGDGTFVPAAPKGFEWVEYPYFKKSIKEGVTYLTLNYRMCDTTKFEHYYLLDGRLATAAETAEIESCLKAKNTYSNKQAAHGVTNANEQTKVLNYCVEGVKYFGTCKADALKVYEGLK